MSTTKHKILKPFYCHHPEIIFDGKPRPAFWGVEWTVVTKNNPQPTIYEHFMRKVDTETEAQRLTLELDSFGGEFAWWQELDHRCWYLNPKYKISVLDRKKTGYLSWQPFRISGKFPVIPKSTTILANRNTNSATLVAIVAKVF